MAVPTVCGMPSRDPNTSNPKRKRLSTGLNSHIVRASKRQAKSDGYAVLLARIGAGSGGPEKVYHAAAAAGETAGLSLSGLKRRHTGVVTNGSEWDDLLALPGDTEAELVEFCVYMNRGGKPLCKGDLDEIVVRALKGHAEIQAAGGRFYQPLTSAAKRILAHGSVSQSFSTGSRANTTPCCAGSTRRRWTSNAHSGAPRR